MIIKKYFIKQPPYSSEMRHCLFQMVPHLRSLPVNSMIFIDKTDKIMLKVSPVSPDDVNPSYTENEQQANSRMKEF